MVAVVVPGYSPGGPVIGPRGETVNMPSFTITIDFSLEPLRKVLEELVKMEKELIKAVKTTTKTSEEGKPPSGPTITLPGGQQVPLIRHGYYFEALLKVDRKGISPGEVVTVTVEVKMYAYGKEGVTGPIPVQGASVTLWDYYFNPQAPPQTKLVKYVVGMDSTDADGVVNFALTLTDVGVHRFMAEVEIPAPVHKKVVTNTETVAVGPTYPSREEYIREWERWQKTQMAMAIATAMGSVVALAVAIYTALRKR